MNNKTNYKNNGSNYVNGYNNGYSGYGKKSRSKKRFGVFTLIFAIVITAIVAGCIGNALALKPEKEVVTTTYEVSYVYHRVTAGDSISYIASLYMDDFHGSFEDYQKHICSENNRSIRDTLHVGEVIKVPIYSEIVTVTKTK